MTQIEQVIEESRLCPFCLLWGIAESEYNLVGPNSFGDEAEFAGIMCCSDCAVSLEQLSEQDQAEMVALVNTQEQALSEEAGNE